MPDSFVPPVVAELGATTTGFTAGIADSIAMLREFAAVAAEVSAQTSEAFATVTNAARTMAAETAALGEQVPSVMGAVSASVEEMAATSNGAFASVGAAAAEVQAAMGTVGTAAAGMAAETGAATTALSANAARVETATASAAASSETAMARMGTAANTMAGSTTSALKSHTMALGAAAFGAFEVIKSASELQSEMVRLRTSAGETGDVIGGKLTGNLKLVSDGVLKMAVDTGTSTKELSEGLYKIESAGFHGAEGLKLLQSAAEGARAEGASLETVSNTLDSAMNSFGFGIDHVNGVMNAMVMTTSRGKASMEELSGALPVVMSKASAAGVSLQEMLGAMATMTAQGVTARQAAQNLQATISHLADQKDPARKAFQSIGLDAQDLAQNLGKRGLTGTFDMVSQAITQHMGKDGMVVVKTMNDSKQATASLKAMMEGMSPAAKDLSQRFLDGSISLGQYKKEAGALPGLQGNMASQFLALAKNAEGFDSMLKNGSGPAQTYISMLSKMMGGSAGLNTYLELSGVHAKTFADNVSAIGKAAEDDSKHVEGFNQVQKTFGFQLSQLKESAATLGTSVGTILLPYVQQFVHALQVGVQFLNQHRVAAAALAAVISGVLAAAMVALTVKGIKGAISAFEDMADGIKLAVTAVRDFEIAQKLAAAASKIMAVAQAALNLVMDANPIILIVIGIVALVAALIYAYNHCTRFRLIVQAAFQGVKEAAVVLWHGLEAVWHGLVAGVEWVWHGMVAVWHTIESVTMTVWNAIAGFFKKWWPLLLVIFAAPIAILVAAWNHFHTQITSTATAIWTGISNFFTTIWHGITRIADEAWTGIKLAVIKPMQWVWDQLVSLWGTVSGWLSAAWNGIKHIASLAWLGIKLAVINPALEVWHEIESIFGKVSHAIGSALESAWNTVKSIGSKFWSVGRDIVMGIVHGVENANSALFNTLKHLASSALDAAKSFLGISSPSRAFSEQVGQWLPHGIAQGVTRNAHVAVGAVTDLAKQTLNGARIGASQLAPAGVGAAAGSFRASPQQPTYVLNLTVQGSVLSERDLRDTVEKQMLRLGMRGSTTYQQYARR